MHLVILGASFAGITTAHSFLKQEHTPTPVKLTLISPNTHFYWNIAAPRALIPGQIDINKLFSSIAEGFSGYSAEKFAFVVGKAVRVDVEGKSVVYSTLTGQRVISYDFLVLATGSSAAPLVPFKSFESTDATREALHDLHPRIENAQTIVVTGGGATGVETAGELAFQYGSQKKIVLVSAPMWYTLPQYAFTVRRTLDNVSIQITSGSRVLDGALPATSKKAADILTRLGVEVRVNTRVSGNLEKSKGVESLVLSDGSTVTADLSISAGGLRPNSAYMASEFLDVRGFIKVDECLTVIGTKNVFAIGDVSDLEPPQFMPASRQAAHLSKSLGRILGHQPPLPYKLGIRGECAKRFHDFAFG